MFEKLRDFDFSRERVHTSLEGWKCKLLWRAGRMTLIKLVIRGLPMYSMPTFTYLSISDELDRLLRRFWWKRDLEKQRCLGEMLNKVFRRDIAWRVVEIPLLPASQKDVTI